MNIIAPPFSKLGDPRVERTKKHQLLDIVTIAICAVIGGADNWVEVAEFGQSKEAWFKTFLDLPNGIPSHDTFGRVFRRLDPQQWQEGFLSWVQAISQTTKGQIMPLDGKMLRRSHDKPLGKKAIHMVSAWASESRLVLGQVKVAEKSNEITASPTTNRHNQACPASVSQNCDAGYLFLLVTVSKLRATLSFDNPVALASWRNDGRPNAAMLANTLLARLRIPTLILVSAPGLGVIWRSSLLLQPTLGNYLNIPICRGLRG